MTPIRLALSRAIAALAGLPMAIIEPFRPTPGTTEGAVMLGLLLVAGGFIWAEQMRSLLWAPLALLVPGSVYVLIGAAPSIAATIAAIRRGG